MLAHNIRHTLRLLQKAPGFAVMALLTVALGSGANTAVFSVVDGVLLRPLPYAAPERLVWLAERPASRPAFVRSSVPAINLDRYRLAESFEGLAGYTRMSRTLTGAGTPVQVRGEEVTSNLFAVLGVSAAIGRVFVPDEDAPGRPRVVILMDGFWRATFGGDPAILGRTLTFDGQPHTIIGVMPPGFRGLSEHGSGYTIDFFVPSAFDEDPARRGINRDQARS